MPCPTCDTDELVETADGWVPCPTCHGEGWVRDPSVPADRGVPTYRPRFR